MAEPNYAFQRDHLLVTLDPASRIVGVANSFIVPYSTIEHAEIVKPEVPGAFDVWLHGLHLAGRIARGRFIDWKGRRRFLWFDHRTQRALLLRLRGHPAYDELVIAVPDPDAAVASIEAGRRQAGRGLGHSKE